MNKDLIKKVFKRVLLWSLLVIILIFLLKKDVKAGVLGYIFGVLISMLNFLLLKQSVERSVKMNPEHASRYGKSQYFMRMMIQGLVLVIGAKADYLDFLMVVLGLLMVKIVIVLSNLMNKNYLKKDN